VTAGARPRRSARYPAAQNGDAVDLRNRAPVWVRDLGRQGLLEWGRATAGLRSTPTLVIIGAQRAGTTSLYRYLTRQQTVVGGLTKEVRYFDVNYGRGERWYRGHFPTERRLEAIARRIAVRPAVCEASPAYLYHPDVPARLAAAVPGARLVAILRDPVERAYSHYQHEQALGFEELTFEEALDAEEERLAGEDASWFAHQHHSYRARGRYAEQLERWLEVFDRSRLLVLRSDDLFGDPETAVNRVLRHAGLPAGASGPFPRQNSLVYDGIPTSVRKRLTREFAPHNARLADAFGPEFAWS
jgi:hypothetical protein